MFRLFNDTDHEISIAREHKYGGEPSTNIIVPVGSPFEGSDTVYRYQINPEDARCVLERRDSMEARVETFQQHLKDVEALKNSERDAEEERKRLEEHVRLEAEAQKDREIDEVRRLAAAGEPLIDLNKPRDPPVT